MAGAEEGRGSSQQPDSRDPPVLLSSALWLSRSIPFLIGADRVRLTHPDHQLLQGTLIGGSGLRVSTGALKISAILRSWTMRATKCGEDSDGLIGLVDRNQDVVVVVPGQHVACDVPGRQSRRQRCSQANGVKRRVRSEEH